PRASPTPPATGPPRNVSGASPSPPTRNMPPATLPSPGHSPSHRNRSQCLNPQSGSPQLRKENTMVITTVITSTVRKLLPAAALALAVTIPVSARAQDAAGAGAPPPVVAAAPTAAAPSGPRMVGGHVGAAVPVVSLHSVGKTTMTPSDQLTI